MIERLHHLHGVPLQVHASLSLPTRQAPQPPDQQLAAGPAAAAPSPAKLHEPPAQPPQHRLVGSQQAASATAAAVDATNAKELAAPAAAQLSWDRAAAPVHVAAQLEALKDMVGVLAGTAAVKKYNDD